MLSQQAMHNGILLIDKPAGITSAGVVARIKHILQAARVGHAGTLDPDATGLLVILINGATRIASYAADGTKVYSGTIKLGVRTSTDDLAGEVLSRSEDIPSFEQIHQCAQRFIGHIQQVPPKVSAVKVGGKRAHKMQRLGEEFELKAREVEVSRLELSSLSPDLIGYRMECSPGTYVRSVARDLGDALGCGAAVATIRRERSGVLSVDRAVQITEVSWELVQDWSVLVPHLPRIELAPAVAAALHNGQRNSLRALEEAAFMTGLREKPGVVMYGVEGSSDTLGLLRVNPDRSVDFEINLGLKLGSPT